MGETLLEFNGDDTVEMPNLENGVAAIGEVDITDSINQDVLTSRLVRHIDEEIKVPNIVIDIREAKEISVSPFAMQSLSAIQREDGNIGVYIRSDKSIEKIMHTTEDLKNIVVVAVKELISPDVNVYENVEIGKRAKKIGGNSIRSMRLNL